MRAGGNPDDEICRPYINHQPTDICPAYACLNGVDLATGQCM